ncbi:MAG: Lactose transport system permease protein LacF [Spirochaetes bacterium ADurb.Bin110]|nr:MAG: Lactose transport system permease protein LacF [Spirochaetes bacterium ADurb.Bin110]HPN03825.1 sugar ABC transporter permease [Rectinema sp.]
MKRKDRLAPYLFISPWILGFIAFTAGPLFLSAVMTMFDWPIIGTPSFVGIKNFIDMFTKDNQFWKSVGVTIKFMVMFVPLNIIIALVLAMLISKPLRGIGIFRTIFYLPSVVSSVAVAIMWGWIFHSEYGLLNYALSLLGISGPRWLSDPSWAIVAIVIASLWSLGTMMLIFYTAIKSIPKDIYEDAIIAGASPFRTFFSITLPLITPTLLFNLITSTIGAMQELSLVLLLTRGGPVKSTYFYGLYVYRNAFLHFKLGYAAANAWFMFIIILLLTLLIFKSSPLWVFYEHEVSKENV